MKYGITQNKLKRYLELKRLVDEFENLEKELKDLLNVGAEQQPGTAVASLNVHYRANIPWKKEFEKALGEDEATKIAAKYGKNVTVEKLIVIDRKNAIQEKAHGS